MPIKVDAAAKLLQFLDTEDWEIDYSDPATALVIRHESGSEIELQPDGTVKSQAVNTDAATIGESLSAIGLDGGGGSPVRHFSFTDTIDNSDFHQEIVTENTVVPASTGTIILDRTTSEVNYNSGKAIVSGRTSGGGIFTDEVLVTVSVDAQVTNSVGRENPPSRSYTQDSNNGLELTISEETNVSVFYTGVTNDVP